MARNNHGEWIPSVCLSNCLISLRHSSAPSELLVGDRLSVWNLHHHSPDLLLKRSTDEVSRTSESRQFPVDVPDKLIQHSPILRPILRYVLILKMSLEPSEELLLRLVGNANLADTDICRSEIDHAKLLRMK